MKDGSDAVADWPLLNALLNTAAGASWVSIHNGGGVGIGYSLHAGQVTVADGSDMMAKRIERVLTTDPGMGIIRHVDAGYEEAKEFAKRAQVKIPMATLHTKDSPTAKLPSAHSQNKSEPRRSLLLANSASSLRCAPIRVVRVVLLPSKNSASSTKAQFSAWPARSFPSARPKTHCAIPG